MHLQWRADCVECEPQPRPRQNAPPPPPPAPAGGSPGHQPFSAGGVSLLRTSLSRLLGNRALTVVQAHEEGLCAEVEAHVADGRLTNACGCHPVRQQTRIGLRHAEGCAPGGWRRACMPGEAGQACILDGHGCEPQQAGCCPALSGDRVIWARSDVGRSALRSVLATSMDCQRGRGGRAREPLEEVAGAGAGSRAPSPDQCTAQTQPRRQVPGCAGGAPARGRQLRRRTAG